MKKKLILFAMVVFTAGIAIAQPRAIGGRLGYNMEVSYQHELTSSMLEVDAGLSPFIYQKALIVDENGMKVPVVYHYGRAQIVLSYDWLESITDGLFLYLGASAGVSWGYGEFFDLPRYNRQGVLTTYRRLGLPIGAQIGLEYDFSIPLNLSLDWRPMVNMFGLRQGDLTSNLLNIAIGVRYRF